MRSGAVREVQKPVRSASRFAVSLRVGARPTFAFATRARATADFRDAELAAATFFFCFFFCFFFAGFAVVVMAGSSVSRNLHDTLVEQARTRFVVEVEQARGGLAQSQRSGGEHCSVSISGGENQRENPTLERMVGSRVGSMIGER